MGYKPRQMRATERRRPRDLAAESCNSLHRSVARPHCPFGAYVISVQVGWAGPAHHARAFLLHDELNAAIGRLLLLHHPGPHPARDLLLCCCRGPGGRKRRHPHPGPWLQPSPMRPHRGAGGWRHATRVRLEASRLGYELSRGVAQGAREVCEGQERHLGHGPQTARISAQSASTRILHDTTNGAPGIYLNI